MQLLRLDNIFQSKRYSRLLAASFFCLFSFCVNAQCCEVTIDVVRSEITKSGIKQFTLINNDKFKNYISIKKGVFKTDLIVSAGKYSHDNKDKTFVIILSSVDGIIRKEAIFTFYASSIDYLSFENKKIFVVFVDETEMYGWIEYINGRYIFTMFEDPEL